MLQIQTVIFDLDGTVYQNMTFHHSYLWALTTGTWAEAWQPKLAALTEEILSGRRLEMNRFYLRGRVQADTPEALVQALSQRMCPDMTYEEAVQRSDVTYLGDAWALLAFLGDGLGLLDGTRADEVYRQTRVEMEREGMEGNTRLRDALIALQKRRRVILLSNSYRETVLEFLRQLGFEDAFREICPSARKPYGMIDSLRALAPELLEQPERLLSIGDHAFNDLMPVSAIGGKTLWMNPYSGIHEPQCDWSLHTLDELADFLNRM